MEIYPDNLGPELEAEVWQNRQAPLTYLKVSPRPKVAGAFLLGDALLTQETAEQMEALQTSLTSLQVGGQPSVPEVGTLLAVPGRGREDTEQSQRQSVGG